MKTRRRKPDPNQRTLPGSDRWGTSDAPRSFVEAVRHHMGEVEAEYGLKLTTYREGTYESAEYVNEHVRLLFSRAPGVWGCQVTIDRQNRLLGSAERTLSLSSFSSFDAELEHLAQSGDEDAIAFLFVDLLGRNVAGPLGGDFETAWRLLRERESGE